MVIWLVPTTLVMFTGPAIWAAEPLDARLLKFRPRYGDEILAVAGEEVGSRERQHAAAHFCRFGVEFAAFIEVVYLDHVPGSLCSCG